MGTILRLFGGKFGIYAALAALVLIGGMYGYIRYTGAQHAKTLSDLRDARRDVEDRDRAISTMQEDRALFEEKLDKIGNAMQSMQTQFARNSQQRRADYEGMTSPKPQSGQIADTDEMEARANKGMDAAWNDLIKMSQPASGGAK